MANQKTRMRKVWGWFKENWFPFLTVVFAGAVAVISLYSYRNASSNMQKQLELTRTANDSTNSNMKQQTAQLKRSIDLQWRPYLNLDHINPEHRFMYVMVGPAEQDTVLRPIDSVGLESDAFRAVQYVSYAFVRNIEYQNSGSTSLLVKKAIFGTITEDAWRGGLAKSPEKLVAEVKRQQLMVELETDITVAPDEVDTGGSRVGLATVLPKAYWTSRIKANEPIYLYPYSYVEYEDFHGYTYNTLRVEWYRLTMQLTGDTVSRHFQRSSGQEVYRYDIEVGPPGQ